MKKIMNITMAVVFTVALGAGFTAFKAASPSSSMKGPTAATASQTKAAAKDFDKLLKAFPKQVGFHAALSHWGFTLPSGEKFEWTKDLSANKLDLAIVLMSDQFTKAGLDLSKLDKNQWIVKPAAVEAGKQLPNRLIIAANINDKKKKTMGYSDAFKNVLAQNAKLLQYNSAEGHYILQVGNGNEVHWTNKLGSAMADFELVVKAEPLVKAGLNITKLKESGWNFEAAGTGDSGKNADQLVKEFKLK